MIQSSPATIANNLIAEANSLLSKADHYLPASDFSFKLLLSKAKKLMQANPYEAHISYAIIYQLAGELDSVNYHSSIAKSIGDPFLAMNLTSSAFINLGKYSEAQKQFKEYGHPKNGLFYKSINQGYASFSFYDICRFIDDAKKMNIDLNKIDTETAYNATKVLRDSGIDEKQFLDILDIAGDTLRENKLFYVNEMPTIFIEKEQYYDPCIYITFFIRESHEKTNEIYESFISKVINQIEELPSSVHISIEAAS